ncbi:hypothetical protein ERJ75_000886200 [Trypanosoma vivax]|uniref:Nucleosome assembly protein n=1 Tax=Trypanosoma vivax (strain Y486) TaxID=1055687 RepID=G0TR94_TRYVY|nr:hypothetical protein TRVL_05238 [Trypanosoma vivax]KAH8612496.1 hypothetical protein ERJ75_000886200 [Trypanosoma vivax]CCC46458.1 conserved hypothetical protein [Trypanosoma vivax Y486]
MEGNLVAADSPVWAIQEQIRELQYEMHKNLSDLTIQSNIKKNEHYATRHEVVTRGIRDGLLPRTFWADAVIASIDLADKQSNFDVAKDGDKCQTLGPYDVPLLRNYLEDMKVTFTEKGTRLSLHFAANPFFEEPELWAEVTRGPQRDTDVATEGFEDHGDKDDHSVDSSEDDLFVFSGITWKPGHGPLDDESDGDEDDKIQQQTEEVTRGWSFLDMFSDMPPPPEVEEFEGVDTSEFLRESDDWQMEADDREQMFRLLVEEVWANPLAVLLDGGRDGKPEESEGQSGPLEKRARTE